MNEKKESKNIDKKILRQISKSAEEYADFMAGRDFLVLYNGQAKEIEFRREQFKHLCGVDTSLYSREFYTKALKKELSYNEIGFSRVHPRIFAEAKVKGLRNISELFTKQSIVYEGIRTRTRDFEFGITNGENTIIFGIDKDKPDKTEYIPQSFRSETAGKTRYHERYNVDFVLYKEHDDKSYKAVILGDKGKLYDYLSKNKIFKYSIEVEDRDLLEKNEQEGRNL